jgi:hypothetical protein
MRQQSDLFLLGQAPRKPPVPRILRALRQINHFFSEAFDYSMISEFGRGT